MAPIIRTTPEGTYVGNSFYANLGNADSAFPSTPPGTTPPPSGGNTPQAQRPNPGIVSSNDYRTEIAGLSSQTDDFKNDPYMALFQQLKDSGAAMAKAQRLQTTADTARQERAASDQEERYKAGLETLGIRSGLSQYAPSLQIDRMIQAENLAKSKIGEIDAAEKVALAKIDAAKQANDLDVMKEQLDYVQQLRKSKADALEKAQQMAFDREKFEWQKYADNRTAARLEAAQGNMANFDFTQTAENIQKNSPGLYAAILAYNADPKSLTNFPQEQREAIVAEADKVSQYETAQQINGFINDRRNSGEDVTVGGVFSDLKNAYSDAGVKLTGAQKKTLKDYIRTLLGE